MSGRSEAAPTARAHAGRVEPGVRRGLRRRRLLNLARTMGTLLVYLIGIVSACYVLAFVAFVLAAAS